MKTWKFEVSEQNIEREKTKVLLIQSNQTIQFFKVVHQIYNSVLSVWSKVHEHGIVSSARQMQISSRNEGFYLNNFCEKWVK